MDQEQKMAGEILLSPMQHFRRVLIRSPSFVGTCSLQDVANFLNAHNTGYAFITWISRTSKLLYFSFVEFHLGLRRRVIVNMEIRKPQAGLEQCFLSERVLITSRKWKSSFRVDIVRCVWRPTEFSTFGDLLSTTTKHLQQRIISMADHQTDLFVCRSTFTIAFSQFHREQHVCRIYFDSESDRKEFEQNDAATKRRLLMFPEYNCFTRRKRFSPQSLKSMCIFMLVNFFTHVRFETRPDLVPAVLHEDLEQFGRRIGTSDFMKRASFALQPLARGSTAEWPEI